MTQAITLKLSNSIPDIKIKRQLLDHYIKGICNLISCFGTYTKEIRSPNAFHNGYLIQTDNGICNLITCLGIYTKEIRSPNAFHNGYIIQTDDVDIDLSKVFTQYIKNIQHQNSQRANSIFTNDVFSTIYNCLSILEMSQTQNDSPTQTSRHTIVRHELHIISKILHAIRENITNDQITQNVKHDLQKILPWFIIDYFGHNVDVIVQAKKCFRPQMTKLY